MVAGVDVFFPTVDMKTAFGAVLAVDVAGKLGQC